MHESRFLLVLHPFMAPLVVLARAMGLRRSWVVAHGTEIWQPLGSARRLSIRQAQGVVAVSADTAERAVRVQGVLPNRVEIISPAIEPTFAAAGLSQRARERRSPVRLLTVARLSHADASKGVDQVLRALPAVRAAVPDLEYVIVGDGDGRHALEALARQLGVSNTARFIGAISTERLIDTYRTSDVFVMPSRTEGFGMVFAEAMSFGIPVIAGNHGGSREIIEQGKTGFKVNQENLDELCAVLARLAEDSTLRASVGAAGRATALERYGFSTFRDRIATLVDGP
jgi:phosphatidylinositol alpha-1,6-mannosyltransferase